VRRQALYAAIVTVAVFGGGELALRAAGLPAPGTVPSPGQPMVIRHDVDGDDWRGWHLFGTDDFVPDPDPSRSCLWVPRPSRAPFNADGAIGPLRATRPPPGTLRVLAIGDSNTLADGAASWVQQIAGPLAGCAEVETINAGVHGYTTWQGRHRLERFIDSRPHVVVLAFGWNDPLPVRAPPDSQYGALLRAAPRSAPLASSALVGSLRAVIAAARRPAAQPRVSRDEFVDNHRAMVRTALRGGALPIVATRPFVLDERHEHLAIDVGHEEQVAAYAGALRELAVAESVPLLDLQVVASAFDRAGDWQDTNHFTAAGHRKAAGMAEELLRGLGVSLCAPPPASLP